MAGCKNAPRPLGSFIDEMRAFHTLYESLNLSADAKLLWFHLFLDANEAHWPERLPYRAGTYAYAMDRPVRRVREGMKELVELGLITHHGRNQGGQSVTLHSAVPMAHIVKTRPITTPLYLALGIPSHYTTSNPRRTARIYKRG